MVNASEITPAIPISTTESAAAATPQTIASTIITATKYKK